MFIAAMKNIDAQQHAGINQTPHINRKFLSRRWLCSIETLKRMENAGELPSLRIGRQALYRMQDILDIEAQAEVRH